MLMIDLLIDSYGDGAVIKVRITMESEMVMEMVMGMGVEKRAGSKDNIRYN